ncbi:hypothetical protein M3Y94_00484500 [Aphelenchoides besseyi]|nr:hypothetical protein M3Y94_00484500 [Aphelenchoides besseyi]KAI6217417.1 hypothetical protein M3Y95_01216900 [Aphelenchoides besseyi]
MASGPAIGGIDDLNRKLAKDEEWLNDFKSSLKKSERVATQVSTILDNFTHQINTLRTGVAPLCTKTSAIQKKQQNVKKLLGITEASIQFYGKTVEFESAIRRGTTNLDLDEYIELMNGLKDAIEFFGSHSSYKGQLEAMRESFEIGCTFLETEFCNCIRIESAILDPVKIAECLDENYEIPSFRWQSLSTFKNTSKAASIARFLKQNTSCLQYLKFFVNFRSENMLKITRLVNDQMRGFVQQKSSKAQFLKTALKKAAGRATEKHFDDPWGESSITVATILLSVLLTLIQIETEVCSKIFASVDVEAQLVRKIGSEPLKECLERGIMAIEQFDATFVQILPLAGFVTRRSHQMTSLSRNIGHSEIYAQFCKKLYEKTSQSIADFVDFLTNEHTTRYVPSDGNCHEITSNAMNFLKILAQYQSVVNHVLEQTQKGGESARLSKLFAQIISALGVNLRNKASAYADPHLAALFLFNNLTYVQQCLKAEVLSKLVREQNPQFFSYNEQEIAGHLKKYLQSWNRVTAVLTDVDADRSVRGKYANFNREFDAVIETQRGYCVADVETAQAIRQRIKQLVLVPYIEFTNKHSQEAYDFNLDRQLKYDAESIEIIIDRLFDVSY